MTFYLVCGEISTARAECLNCGQCREIGLWYIRRQMKFDVYVSVHPIGIQMDKSQSTICHVTSLILRSPLL